MDRVVYIVLINTTPTLLFLFGTTDRIYCRTNCVTVTKPKQASSTEVDFDALQKARSRVGCQGEEYVVDYERNFLEQVGRTDLVPNVEHIKVHSLGFDVRSYEPDGTEKQIEVKTIANKGDVRKFYLTTKDIN